MRRALLAIVIALTCTSSASAMSVQGVVADSHVFLERTLGVELPDRPVGVGAVQQMAECGGLLETFPQYVGVGCGGLAYTDRIVVSPEIWREIKTFRPRWDSPPAESLYAIAHEQMHTLQANVHLEHAAIEGALADMWPAWSKAVVGYVVPPVSTAYPADRQLARTASARATGKSWASREARIWRRALAAGDNATREQMVAAAFGGVG